MSQSFDLSLFPNLPPEVVQAFAAQQATLEAAQFEVVVERAARQHEQAVVAEKEAFITELKALIERLGSRLYAYHVKDMRPDRSMTAVGQGTIDFASLFKLKAGAGVRHFYVENDEAPAPYLPDITTSYRTLRALRF